MASTNRNSRYPAKQASAPPRTSTMAAGSSYEVGSIVSTPRHSAPARFVADPERPPCAVWGRQTLVALTGVIRISFFNNDGSSRSHEDSRRERPSRKRPALNLAPPFKGLVHRHFIRVFEVAAH